MEEIWIPDLEIYGLEDFGSKKVLKEMSGLRIKKNKTLEYNARYGLVSELLQRGRLKFVKAFFSIQVCFKMKELVQ